MPHIQVTSSPILAHQVLHEVADDYQKKYPHAANIIREIFYVDDCLTGTSNVEDSTEIHEKLNHLLDRACMKL